MNTAEAAILIMDEKYPTTMPFNLERFAAVAEANGVGFTEHPIVEDTPLGYIHDRSYYVFTDGSCVDEDWEVASSSVEDAEINRAEEMWERHYHNFHSA